MRSIKLLFVTMFSKKDMNMHKNVFLEMSCGKLKIVFFSYMSLFLEKGSGIL